MSTPDSIPRSCQALGPCWQPRRLGSFITPEIPPFRMPTSTFETSLREPTSGCFRATISSLEWIGLRLTNEIPSNVTVVSSAVSAGVLSTEVGGIVARLGDLKSGASFTETFQLRSSIGGAHPITLTAVATNSRVAAVVATGGGRFFVGPPQPHFREGVIYGRHNADGDAIWYAPSDGGAELKITDGGRPRLSPDGTGLAFVRGNVVGSRANLWWRNLGTGEEKQVFAVGDFLVGLTWSSDSQWIIFDYSCGIYARTRTGGDPGLSVGGSCYYDGPSVQASDGRIAFHSSDGLYLGDAAYQNIHKIPDTHAGDYWPVWSPDGGWIVYVDAADLWMIRPDGMGRTRLTKIGANGEGFNNPAAWTPRGRQVVAAGKVAGKFGLFTIVPSGQDAPVLLRDLPGDSQVTDVGAVVGTLFDGIELQVNLQLLPSGSPRQVLVSGPPQVSYTIEATTDFANWVRVYTNPPATSGAYPEDFNAFRYRFYRGIPLSH